MNLKDNSLVESEITRVFRTSQPKLFKPSRDLMTLLLGTSTISAAFLIDLSVIIILALCLGGLFVILKAEWLYRKARMSYVSDKIKRQKEQIAIAPESEFTV